MLDGPLHLIDVLKPLIVSYDDSGDNDCTFRPDVDGNLDLDLPGAFTVNGAALLTAAAHRALVDTYIHQPGIWDDADPATTYGTGPTTGVFPGLLWIQHETGTPNNVTALKLRNAANDGWITLLSLGVQPISLNDQTDSYTLVLGDAEKYVTITKATAVTLTVPPNSSVAFPVGTTIVFEQGGVGAITVTPGSGVTLHSEGGKLITTDQYAVGSLTKKATDTWTVTGNLTA